MFAAALSRVCRLGSGGMIGGRVMRALQPTVLADLCRGRTVVLVSGTNGKTTTTRMVASAIGTFGEVACNASGANMPDGMIAALAERPHAPYAVLEVDERYLPAVLPRTTPAAVVLLNLSRDQLDRMAEVRHTVRAWHNALARHPDITVVANGDDPLITDAAQATDHQVWVGAGALWNSDSVSCSRCAASLYRSPGGWHCRCCGLARPQPDWQLAGSSRLAGPGGRSVPLALRLPGVVNVRNAAMAVAAAVSLGVPLPRAVAGAESVAEVDGRYRVVDFHNHAVRLLLAKNPAGWAETLRILGEHTHPVVLAVNARGADGRDLSWLWDVPFEQLHGRHVSVCGERAADLAVRLNYAGVAYRILAEPSQAVTSLPPGPVDLVANYTAFRELTARFA
jgi:UDP-N-acetylmuramyl tripeptide synthase